MREFFSLKRINRHLRLFAQTHRKREEERRKNCGRCGIALKGIQMEDMSDAESGYSNYYCIPCAERSREIRGIVIVVGVLVAIAAAFVDLWLKSQ